MFSLWGFLLTQGNSQLQKAAVNRQLFQNLSAVKFPGVLHPEQPARGGIVAPLPGDITNHSTLTMNDGFSGPVIFEFVSSGSAGGGHEEVDISAAVTAEDVATAFANAVATWVGSLSLPPGGGGPGFLTKVDGATVRIVQAFPHRTDFSIQQFQGTWIGKTTGNFGNNAIVPSVAGEWTGRINGMTGGRNRLAGCYARAAHAQGMSQTLPAFVAPIELPPE
jgi:hypothetical protein